jgi:hypothetical protein
MAWSCAVHVRRWTTDESGRVTDDEFAQVVDACDFVILEVVHGNDADFEVLMCVDVLILGAREIDGLVYCLPRSTVLSASAGAGALSSTATAGKPLTSCLEAERCVHMIS